MYPLHLKLSDYDFYLEKEEFDYLVGRSTFSRINKGERLISPIPEKFL
jgi:hypothetical protein